MAEEAEAKVRLSPRALAVFVATLTITSVVCASLIAIALMMYNAIDASSDANPVRAETGQTSCWNIETTQQISCGIALAELTSKNSTEPLNTPGFINNLKEQNN